MQLRLFSFLLLGISIGFAGSVTCTVPVSGTAVPSVGLDGGMTATFTPSGGTLAQVAAACLGPGARFNWYQIVTQDPAPPRGSAVPYIDPLQGGNQGTQGSWRDAAPWYYDVVPANTNCMQGGKNTCQGYEPLFWQITSACITYLANQRCPLFPAFPGYGSDTLVFGDTPASPIPTQLAFETWLVVVSADGSKWAYISGFDWQWSTTPTGAVITNRGLTVGPKSEWGDVLINRMLDPTAPAISSTLVGPLGQDGWYTGPVQASWSVTDPQTQIALNSGCDTVNLTADTPGTTLTCAATNGAGLSASGSATVKIDASPPQISGVPGGMLAPSATRTTQMATAENVHSACTIWPPDKSLVTVGTVRATDALSNLASGSFKVTAVSDEPSDPANPDVLVTADANGGYIVRLRADRLGTGKGRIYTITASAKDGAGNASKVIGSCIVPHDQAHHSVNN